MQAVKELRTYEAIVVTGADLHILMVNPAFTQITGFTPAEVIDKSPRFLGLDQRDKALYQDLRQTLSQRGSWQGELVNRRKDGKQYIEWLSLSAITGVDGKIERYVGLFTDITERKQREQLIQRQANFDALTELPNRNLFQDRLSQELKHAARGGWRLALMFIDLDNFKWVNDTLGHGAGDALLKEVARRLKSCVRASDTLARLGGDEFMLILPGIDSQQGPELAAQKIVSKLGEPFFIDGQDMSISASIGITLYPQDGDNLEALIKNADVAMYRAKEKGRNNYQFFTPEMNELVVPRLILGQELRRALQQGEFILHYQPIIDLGSGALASVEALLRWNHPDKGRLLPIQFIPVAEETGLSAALGKWVLETASQQALIWRERYDANLRITVNFSLRQLRSNELIDFFTNHMRDGCLDHLILEITEAVLVDDTAVVQFLSALRNRGAKISIDDFGTGYSCLGYLRRSPVDYLKIDKEFVLGAHTNLADAALVEAVISVGRGLNMSLVAEGVETVEQLEFLRRRGCDFGRGYYLGRPMAAHKFEKLLLANQNESTDYE